MPHHIRPHIYIACLRTLLALCFLAGANVTRGEAQAPFTPIQPPEWIYEVTRMAFCTPGDLEFAAKAGAQVVHFNLVWPYYPLRRDGGGLSRTDGDNLRAFVTRCHQLGMRACLGLPPFPNVALVKAHPDWRVCPDDTGKSLTVEPKEESLGTRVGCNLGPWGDYLIQVCGELIADYKLDGFSYDGNYHPGVCYCPACKAAYKLDTGRPIPPKIDLDDVGYRQYLVWRGERLEDHYRRLQAAIKRANPNAVLTSWTVNAGRYGQLLYSPRAMPTRLNLLFDLPMQEWWMDETNIGGSLMPAFGAAYLRGVTDDRPNAAEPYMMSRGNPYGTDSFPRHEQIARVLLGITNGSVLAQSLGWTDHRETAVAAFQEVAKRERWIKHTSRMPWAALLVSEQTRQFYAYRDIASIFLPHPLGVFRAATEEHLPISLINDWNLNQQDLSKYRVLVLPNAAALSDLQMQAVRDYVRNGGGLVATGETSLCDEIGRPRKDFGLADLFGVSYRGRPQPNAPRPDLDANFAATLDESYWRQRTGVATLRWIDHPLTQDATLNALTPRRTSIFKGPLVQVTEPATNNAKPGEQAKANAVGKESLQGNIEVVATMTPEGWTKPPLPAIVVRPYGKGRVVYMASAIDAALWSYAYPYQRRLLTRAIEWGANSPFPITIHAPMCVQTTFFEQSLSNTGIKSTPNANHATPQRPTPNAPFSAQRLNASTPNAQIVIHLYNALNTTANHGLPAMDIPLREETIPIHDIQIRLSGITAKRVHVEPGNITPKVHKDRDGKTTVIDLPPLETHAMLIIEK